MCVCVCVCLLLGVSDELVSRRFLLFKGSDAHERLGKHHHNNTTTTTTTIQHYRTTSNSSTTHTNTNLQTNLGVSLVSGMGNAVQAAEVTHPRDEQALTFQLPFVPHVSTRNAVCRAFMCG